MVAPILIVLMFMVSFPVEAGITADELRQIAGDAERTKRERANRVQANDLNSLLPRLERNKRAGHGVSEQSQSKSETSGVEASLEGAERPGDNEQAAVPTDTSIVTERHDTSSRVQSSSTTRLHDEKLLPNVVPRSSKHRKDSPSGSHALQEKTAGITPSSSPAILAKPSHIYMPPARVSTGGGAASSRSDAVKQKQRRFGILIGSWFEARMSRETTNADPGLIEIKIINDVEGNHRTLPAGTMLFASKRYNAGTKRLDLHIIQGVLPGGEEIIVDALVYDSSQVAGLNGIVVENNAGTISGGFKKGVINASRTIATTLTGVGSPAGTVLDSTVSEVADAKQAAAVARDVAPYTIHVSPQPVLIQVQETF